MGYHSWVWTSRKRRRQTPFEPHPPCCPAVAAVWVSTPGVTGPAQLFFLAREMQQRRSGRPNRPGDNLVREPDIIARHGDGIAGDGIDLERLLPSTGGKLAERCDSGVNHALGVLQYWEVEGVETVPIRNCVYGAVLFRIGTVVLCRRLRRCEVTPVEDVDPLFHKGPKKLPAQQNPGVPEHRHVHLQRHQLTERDLQREEDQIQCVPLGHNSEDNSFR